MAKTTRLSNSVKKGFKRGNLTQLNNGEPTFDHPLIHITAEGESLAGGYWENLTWHEEQYRLKKGDFS